MKFLFRSPKMNFKIGLTCGILTSKYASGAIIKNVTSYFATRSYITMPNHGILNKLGNGYLRDVLMVTNIRIQRTLASSVQGIQLNISGLQKKRPLKKKRIDEGGGINAEGFYSVIAYATAEEYDLEKLTKGLAEQNLYEPKKVLSKYNVGNIPDVVHAVPKYCISSEPRDIFFFREGTVVLWNITDLESSNILAFLRDFEQDSYSERLVQEELETMAYKYAEPDVKPHLKDSNFYLTKEETELQKYTFSNAMALSVKLGIWEASLDRYIDSIGYVTEDLKRGGKIRMSRSEVLRKTGELFALRHLINLSSDLLDTPDFYWDREHLEALYLQTYNYFSINKRTKVMNEKLTHCVELADLVSSHLNDKHHIRLEWMIIILIMVEVGFEMLHYVDRYMT